MNGLALLVFLLLLTEQTLAQCRAPARSDGKCGPWNNASTCAGANCCSGFGWCGTGPEWCNQNSFCLPNMTTKLPTNETKLPPGTAQLPSVNFTSNTTKLPPLLAKPLTRQSTPAPSLLPTSRRSTQAPSVVAQPTSRRTTQVPSVVPTNAPPSTQQRTTVIAPRREEIRALRSCGDGKRVIALTFDDGPQPDVGGALLDELRANKIVATYFSSPAANGEEQLPARCDLMRRIVKEGHSMQLHSFTHPHFANLTRQQFDSEMTRSQQFLQTCDARPIMFRPPFGEVTPEQVQTINQKYNMTIAMWNVDPSDFSNPTDSAQAIRDRVVQQFESLVGIGNSAIVLLHEEEAGKRPGLVTMLVEYFQGLKYTFVTVPQCYNNCGQAICGGLDTGVTFMGVESFFFP